MGMGHVDHTQICAVILGVIACYLILNQQRKSHGYEPMPSVAARLASALTAGTTQNCRYLGARNNAIVSKDKKITNVTATAEEANNLSHAEKKKNDDKVMAYAESHPGALYIVFAPWCPHCHKALPVFLAAASDVTVDMAIVNAEMCTNELVQGKLANVTHFPYIFKRFEDGSLQVLHDHVTEANIIELSATSPLQTLESAGSAAGDSQPGFGFE